MAGVSAMQQLAALETQANGRCRKRPIGVVSMRIVAAGVLDDIRLALMRLIIPSRYKTDAWYICMHYVE